MSEYSTTLEKLERVAVTMSPPLGSRTLVAAWVYGQGWIVQNTVLLHAEVNAICKEAKHGRGTASSTMYLHPAPTPCVGCAAAIIAAGITRIVGRDREFPNGDKWADNTATAEKMLRDAGIEIVRVPV